MTELVRLSFRSLRRNVRRTVITLIAVAIGVAVVVFAFAFGEGIVNMIVDSGVDGRVGAVQVHKKGFMDAAEASPLSYDFPAAEVLAKVRAVPGVEAAAPRLRFNGNLTNGVISSMMVAEAVDPALEKAVCPARDVQLTDTGGSISAEIARSMNVTVGGSLTLTAPGKGGSMNALDLTVASLAKGAGFLEAKRIMTVPLAYAQELLSMPDRATEIAVRIDPALKKSPGATAAAIQKVLGDEYEVQTWDEVLPFVRDASFRLRVVLRGISIVLFLLVVFGVVNTMLMSVYERVREIGTMLAVGVTRRQVLVLFVLEAVMIGLFGGLIGATLGFTVAHVLAQQGVVFTPPGAAFAYIVRPVPSLALTLLALSVATLGAALAALYPARKAAALSPVEALRGN